MLIQQASGAIADLRGWVTDREMHPIAAHQITDSNFAEQVSRHIEWLRNFDKLVNSPSLQANAEW